MGLIEMRNDKREKRYTYNLINQIIYFHKIRKL